jgi:hypothetical protein
MDGTEHQLQCLAEKVETLHERVYSTALAHQSALAELRLEVTSLGHGFAENHQDLQHIDHAVRGNGKIGLVERVLKLEQAQVRLDEQRKRTQAVLYTVLGALVVYVLQQLIGKLL